MNWNSYIKSYSASNPIRTIMHLIPISNRTPCLTQLEKSSSLIPYFRTLLISSKSKFNNKIPKIS